MFLIKTLSISDIICEVSNVLVTRHFLYKIFTYRY